MKDSWKSATDQSSHGPENSAGVRWEPSNGSEFLDFISCVCGRCRRLHGTRATDDRDEYNCTIVHKAMDRSIETGPAPDEWRTTESRVFCTARLPHHTPA